MVCDSVCSVANPLLVAGSTLDESNMYWLLLYNNANCVQALVRFVFSCQRFFLLGQELNDRCHLNYVDSHCLLLNN